MNIIGDVAGRFKELVLLVEKMPDEEFLFVGDLNDRGTETPEVIDWVMENARCVQSNHGDMFVDYVEGTKLYQFDIFTYNGGFATLNSYTNKKEKLKKHIDYLKKLPFYYEDDNIYVSHAATKPWDEDLTCVRGPDGNSILWNRDVPTKIEGKLQIMGHNSHWGLRYFGGRTKPWAICIDQSGEGLLTGINYPSLEIYTQEYLPLH